MPKINSPESIGGTYQSYAPGNGAIAFVHVDKDGNATSEQVPLYIAEILKPEDWKLTDRNGQIEACNPVNRVNDILEMDGQLFRYGVEFEGNGWRRYWFKDAEEDYQIKNLSTIGSLSYFLNNEERLKQ